MKCFFEMMIHGVFGEWTIYAERRLVPKARKLTYNWELYALLSPKITSKQVCLMISVMVIDDFC